MSRADDIIAAADAQSHSPGETLEQSRMGNCWEIGTLRAHIRTLCAEIDQLQSASRAQGERIEQLQFDAAKGDDEFEQQADELSQRIAAFNRSTGAAEALRGGL